MTGYLVDTNVVSEVYRPAPDARVEQWLASVEPSTVYISALTVGEIERGIVRLPFGFRRTALESWLRDDLLLWFAGRVLSVDIAIARRWGQLAAASMDRGRPLPVIDGLIAATAMHHSLTVVTRNTADFEPVGVPILNPWL